MHLKQISVFVENKPGRLSEVTGYFANESINIHAMSLADTTDFGILRMIVSDPDKAKDVLKKHGFTVKTTEVIAVAMEHTPGSLYRVLMEMDKLKINIEYMYAFTTPLVEDAMVILRLDKQDDAVEKLKNSGVNVLGADLIDKLKNNI